MAREIKFRAWDKENSCWFDDNWNLSLQPDGIVFGRFDNEDWLQLDESRYDLMQYTGLKDKNGIEIYEGDVVRRLETDWPSKSEDDPRKLEEYLIDISKVGEIVFDVNRWYVKGCGGMFPGAHGFIEVIGNIYENGELLNVQS